MFYQALNFYNQDNFCIGVALTRNNQGLAEYAAKRPDAARSQFEAALAIYREEDYQRGIAEVLTNLGVLSQEQGDLESRVATPPRRFRDRICLAKSVRRRSRAL